MSRIFTFTIEAEAAGLHAGAYLLRRGFSGTLVKAFRHGGGLLTLNGAPAPTNAVLKAGDVLYTELFEVSAAPVNTDAPNIYAVYEDEDVLVADKPAGMAVHPSQGNHGATLYDAFYAHCPGGSFHCINRLDRGTSGLVLIAKNRFSAAVLTESMKRREIRREYFAVCAGIPPAHGVIDAPIARVEGSTIARCVDYVNGEEARTRFERLSYGAEFSVLRLRLDTGRTHQIRVHLGFIGHPLPGDFIYNPDYRYIRRPALHSRALDFPHPATGEAISLSSPLPQDFRQLLALAQFLSH